MMSEFTVLLQRCLTRDTKFPFPTFSTTFCSWEKIRKTANITDSQLIQKFRNTALYDTVKDALARADGGVEKTLLPLDEAAILPTQEELESRWPGHSTDQIQALMRDYESEQKRLVDLDLHPIMERVKELAIQELEEEMVL